MYSFEYLRWLGTITMSGIDGGGVWNSPNRFILSAWSKTPTGVKLLLVLTTLYQTKSEPTSATVGQNALTVNSCIGSSTTCIFPLLVRRSCLWYSAHSKSGYGACLDPGILYHMHFWCFVTRNHHPLANVTHQEPLVPTYNCNHALHFFIKLEDSSLSRKWFLSLRDFHRVDTHRLGRLKYAHSASPRQVARHNCSGLLP